MNCYFGGSYNPFEHEYVATCFANSRKEAKKIMWEQSELSEECNHDWFAARVIRKPEFDPLLDTEKNEPYIVNENTTLREMGWRCEGDLDCAHCGKYDFDGAFPVCDECESCIDCGHNDECASAKSK